MPQNGFDWEGRWHHPIFIDTVVVESVEIDERMVSLHHFVHAQMGCQKKVEFKIQASFFCLVQIDNF